MTAKCLVLLTLIANVLFLMVWDGPNKSLLFSLAPQSNSGDAGNSCDPVIKSRLVSAGYSDSEATRLCAPAKVFFDNSGLVILRSVALYRFVNSIAPLNITTSGPQSVTITLEELMYCGSGAHQHEAKLLAFGHVNMTISHSSNEVVIAPMHVRSGDCQTPLAALANRATAGDKGSLIASLDFTWKPWDLRLRVTDVQGPAATAVRAAIVNSGDVPFPVDDISVPLGSSTVPFSTVFYFRSDNIAVAALPKEKAAEIKNETQVPNLEAFLPHADLGSSEFLVMLPHVALNNAFTSYFGSGPGIEIGSDGSKISLRNVRGTSTNENSYQLDGMIQNSAGQQFTSHIDLRGAELKVFNLKLTAKQDDTNAKNSASLATQALLAIYRNRAIKSLLNPAPIPIQIGDSRTRVITLPQHVQSSNGSIFIKGLLMFEKP